MEKKLNLCIIWLIPIVFFGTGVDSQASFTLVNKCGFTVWPGILSNAGVAPLSATGFALETGKSQTISAPSGWGGRFWGRTYCTQGSNGQFSCATGDCGSGQVTCGGAGAIPPATLAEFTLDGSGGMDFYDISLVDGYNLPILVVPQGGSGVNCTPAGCISDLNNACPTQLRVDSVGGGGPVACKSACDVFGSEEFCCSGAYSTPATCQPSRYSQLFKSACPQAYSYAYDDRTSTFTCTGADYTITFCPSPNTGQKSSSEGQAAAAVPATPVTNRNLSMASNMVYEAASDSSSAASSSMCWHVIATAITVGVAALWRFL